MDAGGGFGGKCDGERSKCESDVFSPYNCSFVCMVNYVFICIRTESLAD